MSGADLAVNREFSNTFPNRRGGYLLQWLANHSCQPEASWTPWFQRVWFSEWNNQSCLSEKKGRNAIYPLKQPVVFGRLLFWPVKPVFWVCICFLAMLGSKVWSLESPWSGPVPVFCSNTGHFNHGCNKSREQRQLNSSANKITPVVVLGRRASEMSPLPPGKWCVPALQKDMGLWHWLHCGAATMTTDEGTNSGAFRHV